MISKWCSWAYINYNIWIYFFFCKLLIEYFTNSKSVDVFFEIDFGLAKGTEHHVLPIFLYFKSPLIQKEINFIR